MFWIALTAAVQFSGPSPDDGIGVFSPTDMPAYVQTTGINRHIFTRSTIGPDGAPQDCAVESSGGDHKLDALTCAIILKRAKFQPSRWLDGSPVHAVLRIPVSWAIGGAPSNSELRKAYPPDVEIFVDRLPAGVKKRAEVRLLIAVDANGKVASCAEGPRSKRERKKSFPQLVPLACHQMRSYTAVPAKDASGKAVRSVQNAFVEFSTGS